MDWVREHRILWKKIGIMIGVYLGMKYLVPLVIPFFIAAWIVCACWPFLRRVKKKLHIKPPFVMAFLLMLLAAVLAAGLYLAGQKAGGTLSDFLSGANFETQAEQFLYDCCEQAGELLHLETEGLRVFVTEQLTIFRAQAQQKLLPGALGNSWQAVKKVGSWVTSLLVTVISILLLSADYEKIQHMGQRWSCYERLLQTVRGIWHSVGGYLKAQGILMGIVMLICIAGIWTAGMVSGNTGSPVLAGIGTGLLDALPVFGTGTVFLPWVLIKLFQKEYLTAFVLAATYGICVLTREFLEPKLVGDRLGVLPIVILMSVYVGVKLYGLGGILLGPLSVLLVQELWRQAEGGGEGRNP